MTQTLTARLAARLESQTAEIEALTAAELTKLAAGVRESANAALSSIELDILRRRDAIRGELPWLKWILFGTWAALIASLSLAGFLLWRSTASEPSRASFPTFSEEGQTYLVLPAGAETVPCRSGSETLVCVVLPKPGGR